jgi:hypothetical protein
MTDGTVLRRRSPVDVMRGVYLALPRCCRVQVLSGRLRFDTMRNGQAVRASLDLGYSWEMARYHLAENLPLLLYMLVS